MIDLFVLACVLSRVDASIRKLGPSGAAREIEIATAFAGQARRRVKHTVSEIDDNQDEHVKALADLAFEAERYTWDVL
jgi:hypothetical protein